MASAPLSHPCRGSLKFKTAKSKIAMTVSQTTLASIGLLDLQFSTPQLLEEFIKLFLLFWSPYDLTVRM